MRSSNAVKSKALGLYFHIPFCLKKCAYCDFVSFADCGEESIDAYVDRLIKDVTFQGGVYRNTYYVDTIFIGGGTPSMLKPEQVRNILTASAEAFGFKESVEITMEANPESLNAKKLQGYMDAGVNRLSIGIQSLDDGVLKRMGRVHDGKTALETLRMARTSGINLNADLMLGAPLQSVKSFDEGLRALLREDPDHVSFYSLQLEMGTPFYRDFKDGNLELPTWEENRAMYRRALEILKDAGYEHYEISNAAKPGRRCRHNLKYWTMADYLGIGIAAHSFMEGKRFFTGSSLDRYIEGALAAAFERETESSGAGNLKTDFLFTGLRLMEGISRRAYEDMFGCSYEDDFGGVTAELVKEGYMEEDGDRLKLSPEGLDATNSVMERLFNA